MSVNFKVDINVGKILKVRGLGGSKDAQKYLASEVKRFSDPYTPMQQGMLQKATIASDGSTIIYTAPYAHYQWEGVVYGPNYTNGERFWSGKAPKTPTGKAISYSGAPMRGKQWTLRMMADKSKDIERSMDAFFKQKGG